MLTRQLLTLALLLAHVHFSTQAQIRPQVSKLMRETAAAELEAVLVDAVKLDGKLDVINVRSRAAALVSLSDPARAENMFRELWNFAHQQTDKDFDIEKGRALILKQVFPRNPKLANRLLREVAKPESSSLGKRASGQDPGGKRTAKLASELADENPRAASELLESSLTKGVTPAGLNALLRLRERDALLSDFVVGKTLEALRSQPDVIALGGLHLLSAYIFPEGGFELSSSLQALQVHFFSTAYDVLKISLTQSDAYLMKQQHYAKADLLLRSNYQALISLTLAALAPNHQPASAMELKTLANKLGPRLPTDVALMTRLTNARLAGDQALPDNPELAIPLAIQAGDFAEASRLIDKLDSEEMRALYSQVLAKVEAQARLATADVLGALTRIRQIEDQNARLILYLEALRTAHKKQDPSLSSLVLSEARSLIPQSNRNGLHVRALLAFACQLPVMASPDEAVEFLRAAVTALNSLARPSEKSGEKGSALDRAWAEMNDPQSLLEASEFSRSFAAIGLADVEQAIIEARKIEVRSIQLVARLEAVGEVMRIEARRSRSKPTPKPLAIRSQP